MVSLTEVIQSIYMVGVLIESLFTLKSHHLFKFGLFYF